MSKIFQVFGAKADLSVIIYITQHSAALLRRVPRGKIMGNLRAKDGGIYGCFRRGRKKDKNYCVRLR